jgi:DNA/RNA endonuclease YhcR with UshA esterase domain
MRLSLCTLVMIFGTRSVVAEEFKPVNAATAIEQVGKPTVLVEMEVKKAKDRLEKRGIIFLDSEDDFKSSKNLGIAISAEAAAKFKEKGIEDPASHFQGKTIRVRGCVMRFEDRPYLPVHDPNQITIVDKK